MLIGLTGGIGSGKSTVARLFAEHGAHIIDADQIARDVVEPGSPVLASLVAEFGPTIIQPDGTLDRKALGAIVFQDDSRRKQLEAIIHPAIRSEIIAQMDHAERTAPEQLHIVDIPLLFESGYHTHNYFKAIVLADVPESIQIARLCARENWSEDQARSRMATQMPLSGKRSLATHLIDNAGTIAETEAQIEAFISEVRGQA
jgi:dephospho-CoA kinase